DRAPRSVQAGLALGKRERRRAAEVLKIERPDQSRAAADAMAFDGGDRDLIHLLPRLAQFGTEPLAMDALADRELIALPAFGVLEIEARRKGLGRAGQDHDRGLEIVLEVARHVA